MNSGRDLSIRSYSGPEFGELSALNETTYSGREISDSTFLRWEYEKNPEGHAVINIAEENDRIVSQYIVLPRTFSVSNDIVNGSLSVNTLTHPSHRGKGLFKKLAERTFDQCPQRGIHFTVGFPNPISHPLIRKDRLFETIGYLPLLVLPLHPFKSALKYFSGSKQKSGEEIMLNISQEFFTGFPGVSSFDFTLDKIAYENLVKVFNSKKHIVKNRSFQFLKWRYSDIPIRKYNLIKFESENELKALVVLRAKNIFGLRCGILVDMVSVSGDEDVQSLIKVVRRIAVQNNLDLIFTAISSNSPEFVALKHSGYFSIPGIVLPQKLAFIVRKHTKDCPMEVGDFKKWFLTFGDYDIF